MDDIFVGRLMSPDVVTVTADTSVADAAKRLRENEIGSVVVVDGVGKLAGILTSTDFVEMVAGQEPKDNTPVSEYMTTDVVTVTAQDRIQQAADQMITRGIHHLPVVDGDDHVIGMLSTTDLTAYISAVSRPTPV